MTLRQRKSDKPSRKLTPAQVAANTRSFRIFRLRGLWHQASLLTEERAKRVQAIIDDEIFELGAVIERERQAQRERIWERIGKREADELDWDIPF